MLDSIRRVSMVMFGICAFANAGGAGASDALVCEHAGFEGRCVQFSHGVSNLREYGLNDRISSMRIRAGRWLMCVDADFEGRCEVFERSVIDLAGTPFQDSISSLRPLRRGEGVGEGYGRSAIAVWIDADFRGGSAVITEDMVNLKDVGLNDEISSLRVLGGRWEVCVHSRYRECVEVRGEIRNLREIGLNDEVSSIRELPDRPQRERGRSRRF